MTLIFLLFPALLTYWLNHRVLARKQFFLDCDKFCSSSLEPQPRCQPSNLPLLFINFPRCKENLQLNIWYTASRQHLSVCHCRAALKAVLLNGGKWQIGVESGSPRGGWFFFCWNFPIPHHRFVSILLISVVWIEEISPTVAAGGISWPSEVK